VHGRGCRVAGRVGRKTKVRWSTEARKGPPDGEEYGGPVTPMREPMDLAPDTPCGDTLRWKKGHKSYLGGQKKSAHGVSLPEFFHEGGRAERDRCGGNATIEQGMP